MNIVKKTSTVHTSSYANRPIKYIVLHYTAGTSSKAGVARNIAAMFGNPNNRAASADFIVDDGEIVQYNPDLKNRYCYSVGDKKYGVKYNSQSATLYGECRNYNSISIEMCSSKVNKSTLNATDTDWYLTDAVVNNAVELTKYLMKTYNVPANRVVMHNTVTGKPCPQPWTLNESRLSGWYAFKKRLTGGSSVVDNTGSETAVNYSVMVTDHTGLNCRSGIGTGFNVVISYPYGTILTITKESYGWGFANKTGWVNLSYTRKVSTEETHKEKGVEDMTTKEFIEQLSAEDCLALYNKAMSALAKQGPSSDLASEGHWDRAKSKGITDGSAPKKPMTREQGIAMLGRAGLI